MTFVEKLKEFDRPRPSPLSGEGMSYAGIMCTECDFKDRCASFNGSNPGCTARNEIYEREFSEIKFKSDDPIAENRLRLVAKYYVELQLRRRLGLFLSSKEAMILKTTMSELGKLAIDKKGDLIDQKSKAAIPWEQNPEMLKMKEDVKRNKQLEAELEIMKAKIDIDRKRKKDEEKA
jgi:hypothetical protein